MPPLDPAAERAAAAALQQRLGLLLSSCATSADEDERLQQEEDLVDPCLSAAVAYRLERKRLLLRGQQLLGDYINHLDRSVDL